ncbi:DUF397 domain-containing protein [Nocardiopsis sp. CNR-923]|nr:DUF397 domain-containing protein [Nocardiopsis sp. CNR-923]
MAGARMGGPPRTHPDNTEDVAVSDERAALGHLAFSRAEWAAFLAGATT